MDRTLIGTWVEIELMNNKKWIGKLQEWDEEAIYINNGFEFGHPNYKGAEYTNGEASRVTPTELREFEIK